MRVTHVFALCSTAVVSTCIAISSQYAAAAETIKLSTGETLTVEIIEVTDEVMRVRHPVLGEMTLPRASVSVIDTSATAPATAPASDEEQTSGEATPAQPAPGAGPATTAAEVPPAAPPKEWNFKLTLAAGAATGNSENANLTSIFTATRETEQLRTVLDAGYFYAESGDVRSENRFTAGARNDWLNPGSKWFYFATLRYDYDEFQSWDQRVAGHVGIGYKLIEPPAEPPGWKLNLLAGIGAIKEFGSDNEDVRPEGLFGVEGAWAISAKQSVTFSSTVFPDLSEIGEFRWVNAVAWSALIDEETALSLTAGLAHEYQSQVDEGREKNDLRVFAGVNLEF